MKAPVILYYPRHAAHQANLTQISISMSSFKDDIVYIRKDALLELLAYKDKPFCCDDIDETWAEGRNELREELIETIEHYENLDTHAKRE